MRGRIYYALKDIKKNILSIIIFMGQLVIFTFFLLIVINELFNVYSYGKNMEKLYDYNLVYFNTYYHPLGTKVTEKVDTTLKEVLDDKKRAYSIIENFPVQDIQNIKTVVALGNFQEIYDINLEKDDFDNQSKIPALLGRNVKNVKVGDEFSLNLLDKKVVIVGELPKNSSYFKRQMEESLNNSILILSSYEGLGLLRYHNVEQIITNITFVDPDIKEINDFINNMEESNLSFTPNYFNDTVSKLYRQNKTNILFFFTFFLFTFAFSILGILSNLITLVDKNLQEFAVHLLYGGTLADLYWRTYIYVASMIFLPLLASLYLLEQTGLKFFSNLTMLIWGGILIGLISLYPLWKLKNKDLVFYLRRDY
ncbi:hypothetical protein [Anaerobranca gottschalkii]|uniref:FtsX-like permease family protein n=1 Tax=Anaerobranca gottschalkii DSM 13577 TaxID=1120990 RepID=A0A1H9YMG9_9FIRM|nr:hypothetical protein [Anaerobranca gottschalkii]SES70163.1 hypothetical protein SAMN03080614_10044 [Anaerobranca gottschalkii DSM 13577]